MAGSVRQLPSGTWRARVRIAGLSYQSTWKTAEEAREWCEGIRLNVEARKTSPLTLAKWCNDWIEERSRNREINHPRREHSLRTARIEPWTAAHLPLSRLTRKQVATYVRKLLDSGLSRQTVKHVLRLIRTALNAAHDVGLVRGNVAYGVRVPRQIARRHVPPGRWLELDEIEMALAEIDKCAAAEGVRAQARAGWPSYFRAAIYTGLRKSELLHLRWANVGEDRLSVRAPLKSRSALRDVPLLAPARSALAEWREISGGEMGYVWPARHGGRHHEDFRAGWPGIRSRVGLSGVRFHDLRVTCGSHLVQGSWGVQLSLSEARDWLGHSSITVTERHYARLDPQGIQGKVERLFERDPEAAKDDPT